MKTSILNLLLLVITLNCAAQGSTARISNFKSKFVKERNIDIWLPEGYNNNKAESYPVLYLQNGQNVFNAGTSTSGMALEADVAAAKLMSDEKVSPFIIVAIWSTDNMFYEYFPEKAAQYLTRSDLEEIGHLWPQKENKKPIFLGDEYLKFIASELKPYIDKNYRTKPQAEHTSIGGNAMGGLISIYAVCEYPEFFGQAACSSAHWPILNDNSNMNPSDAVRKYLEEHLPAPKDHRIYFDYGTKGTDKYYEAHQLTVDQLMRNKGYDDSNWATYQFEGGEQTEKSLKERLETMFQFLFPAKKD